jgi:hypothetical protein
MNKWKKPLDIPKHQALEDILELPSNNSAGMFQEEQREEHNQSRD